MVIFSINLPQNSYSVHINYIGFKSETANVQLNFEEEKLQLTLLKKQEQLSEVVVRKLSALR